MKREVYIQETNNTFAYEAIGGGLISISLNDEIISKAERLVNAEVNYAPYQIPASVLWSDDAAINSGDTE